MADKDKKQKRGLLCDWFMATEAYLHETTIHGFRYLATDEIGSRNLLEVIFWVSGIVAAFAATTLMLYQSFDEGRKFPILTTVDTINVNKVPFPAITVDAGEVVNPWGHAERLLDMFDYECYDTPHGCPEKEVIRETGMTVINPMVRLFFEKYKLSLEEWTHKELKNHKGPFNKYGEFERAVAILAVIKQRDKKYDKVPQWLVDVTADVFGRYNNRKVGYLKKKFDFDWGRDHFYPKILEEQASYNISDEDVQACLDEGDECKKHDDAIRTLILPNFVYRVPFQGLGAGEFISYFTRRALSTGINVNKKHHNENLGVFLANSGGNNSPNEILVAEFLGDLTKSISNKKINMNSFEMTNLLDMPHRNTENIRHASYYGDRYNCTLGKEKNSATYFNLWKSYVSGEPYHQMTSNEPITERPCSNDTDAVERGIDGCCKLSRLMAEEHELVGRILKHAMQAPHFTLSKEEFAYDFGNISETVPFPVKTLDYEKPPINKNPRIFQCRYNQKPIEDGDMAFCNIFARSYSNEGFAYSFNNRHFWNKHREDNAYNKRFYDIFHPMPTEDFPDIVYPATSGSSYGLSFTLQLSKYQQAAKDDMSMRKIVPMFKVAIHDPQKPADLRSEGVRIEPGYTSTFLITPSQVFTSDNVKKLEVDRRKCKFHSENEGLKIFTEYTKQGCVFECKLLQADEKCGCLPWNYPSPVNTSICDYMGNYCFQEVMSDTEATELCDCPNDCDETRYSYSVSSTALDVDRLCGDKDAEKLYTGEVDGLDRNPQPFMGNYEQLVNDRPNGRDDNCRRNLKDMAFLQFQLASQTVTQIKREERVTLSDHVSNFGGTLGLFTGMSILSIGEMIFWGVRLMTGWTKKGKKVSAAAERKQKKSDPLMAFTQEAPFKPESSSYFKTQY